MISLVAGVIIWGRVLNVHLFSFPQEETHYATVFIHPCRAQEKQPLKRKFYCIIETVFKISLCFDNFLFFWSFYLFIYMKSSKICKYIQLSKNWLWKYAFHIYKYRCIHIYDLIYNIMCLCVYVKHSLIIALPEYAFFPPFTPPHRICSSLPPPFYFHALWLVTSYTQLASPAWELVWVVHLNRGNI